MICPDCRQPVSRGSKTCPSCGTDLPLDARGGAGLSYPDDAAQSPTLPPGTEFAGRFTIIEKVAEGGMGVVYKAIDETLDHVSALKLIHPWLAQVPEFVERFKREVRVTHKISHSNVCRVFDLGDSDGTLYISMQWVQGETLQQLLSHAGRLDTARALEIAAKIARALEAAHAEGVVHRDLKPANVMIDDEGEVHVMDFGLAAEAGGKSLSHPGMAHGTPLYMSPEQFAQDQVDERADLYALGLILQEMLTGTHPAPGPQKVGELRSHVSQPVVPVLGKLLAWNREERYTSAEEVARVLMDLRQKYLPAPPPQQGFLKRHWRAVALGALGAIAIMVGAYLWTKRPPPIPPETAYIDRGYHYLHDEAETLHSIDNAVSMFNRAMMNDSTSATAWAGLGEAYWVRFERTKDPGMTEIAERAVARAHQLDSTLPEALNAEARGFITQGKYHEARQVLKNVVAKEPKFDIAWGNLGRAHRYLEEYAEALQAFRTAIRLRPDRFIHHIDLGNFYQQFGEYHEAEKSYQQAIALKPESPIAWSNLGAVLLRQGKSEEAVTALERSLKIEEIAAAHSNLGTAYYQLGRYEDAAASYRRATELQPTSATYAGNLGDALRMLGRAGEAQAAYAEAVRRARARAAEAPLRPGSRISLALWCARAGDGACALEEASQAAAMQPGDINILFRNAVVRCVLERDDDALDWLEKAVNLGLGRAEIENEPDLERLRDLPRYRKMLLRAH